METGRASLPPYRAMLVAARDRIGARVSAGETIETIVAARPLVEFEDSLGGSKATAEFVRRVAVGMRGVGR